MYANPSPHGVQGAHPHVPHQAAAVNPAGPQHAHPQAHPHANPQPQPGGLAQQMPQQHQQNAMAPAAQWNPTPVVTAPQAAANNWVTGAYAPSGDQAIDRLTNLEACLKRFGSPLG